MEGIYKKEKMEELILVLLSSLTIALNLAETIMISKTKVGIKPYEKLLCSLSISDLLVAITVFVFKMFDLLWSDVSFLKEDMFSVFLLFSLICSVCNSLAITVDRLIAVKFPIKHRIKITNRKMNVIISIVWFLCVLQIALYTSFWLLLYEDNLIKILRFVSGCLLVYGLFAVTAYIYIFYLSYKAKKATTTESTHKQAKQKPSSFFGPQYSKERRVFFTCCIVTLSYVACSYPFAIEILIINDAMDVSFPSKLILLLNSATNPFIYFFKGYFERKAQTLNRRVQTHERGVGGLQLTNCKVSAGPEKVF